MQKPKIRSKFRLFFGRYYFYLKKQLYWRFSGVRFSRETKKTNLKYEIFSHQTMLLRPLKDVEMWMQHGGVHNLRLAIKKLDGLVLGPGEVFSYWLLIGLPTQSKGYLDGMVLHNGGFKAGIGGGLCQLSNLIYWMILHTPLSVIERWRHSYDVFPDANRTQPFGSGATCSYPNIDLQIKNQTQAIFQLRLEITATHLVGRIFSDKPLATQYTIEERDHSIKPVWWGGYIRHNRIFKLGFDLKSGEKLSEELVAENNAIIMYEPLLQHAHGKNK